MTKRASFICFYQFLFYLHRVTVHLCPFLGSESLLPLRIKGQGLGPKLKLNFNLMDMKNVFMGDKDHYEVKTS